MILGCLTSAPLGQINEKNRLGGLAVLLSAALLSKDNLHGFLGCFIAGPKHRVGSAQHLLCERSNCKLARGFV